MQHRHRFVALAALLVAALPAATSRAVISTRSVPSSFGGNGHNASFDGRLFLVRDHEGWQANLLRPEAATFLPDGLPDALGPLWSPKTLLLGPGEVAENALAICEQDPASAPYACDEGGAPSAAGPFDCYSTWIIDSDAVTPADQGGAVLRRRHLTLWVQSPKTADASVYKFAWDSAVEPLVPTLRGIEPTVSADGKLLIWQGHPSNSGEIDVLMYAVNPTPCGATGWSAGASIARMHVDPAVVGVYPLAERKLRAADGTEFGELDLFRGAYPWLMPEGDAIVFAAAPMPCQGPENPPGCGPRRNALSVIGYPTNWGVAHIDGGVNPDTDQTVRLFFSSPGPNTFPNLPVTPGADVWPFFGSNTSNYVELSFDDGLDGDYAGYWHFNESITHGAELDVTRTPDVSGYFNTGSLEGNLGFAKANDGVIGKSLWFDGTDDRVEVPTSQSLNPVNGITIAFDIRPTADPDCNGENNYRLLLGKGNPGDGSYTVVFEENAALQARVNVDGVQQSLASPALPLHAWTHVSFEYDGATGKAGFWFDGQSVAAADLTPGTITSSSAPLTIGGPGPRDACPSGDGAFAGQLDEVAISRYARELGEPPAGSGAGATGSTTTSGDPSGSGSGTGSGAGAGSAAGSGAGGNGGAGAGSGSGAGHGATSEASDGCGCRIGEPGTARGAMLLLALVAFGGRRARRRGWSRADASVGAVR